MSDDVDDDADEEVSDEITLRHERRWIPVSERLPDEGEPVLWYDRGDTFCHCVVGKRDCDSIEWADLTTSIDKNVTHWQPLPQPPEVSDD